MREFYTANTIFGGKMIQTVSQMKMKFQLRQQELLEIFYFVALPGADESIYNPHNKNSEYIFLHTFTEMDVSLRLEGGDHYFRVPAKKGLIL